MKNLIIGWLYPELMNIYGDRGNIMVLEKRAKWRGIKTEISLLNPGFTEKDLRSCNLLMMGGAQDKQQTIVNEDLKKHHNIISEMIENGTPGLYVCGGFQFLGNYYREADGTIIDGLGIFDLHTENPGENSERLIGNIVIEPMVKCLSKPIVGFENHGGRTYLGNRLEPLGKVLKGHGNNGDGYEGAIYKNSFGTYLHGPVLPKNPQFADYLIKLAIGAEKLEELDDRLENQANKFILERLGI
jgi:lipid II isoglutaminyl synthase (glutamine-hydrolysing)